MTDGKIADVDHLIYEDDDYTVYWVCDDQGINVWFEIAGKGLTPGVKNIAYVAALAAIGERFLQNSLDEDVYTNLTHD